MTLTPSNNIKKHVQGAKAEREAEADRLLGHIKAAASGSKGQHSAPANGGQQPAPAPAASNGAAGKSSALVLKSEDVTKHWRDLMGRREAQRLIDEADLAAVRGLRVIHKARDFAKIPKPQAVIEDILAAEANLLGGPTEAGKSLLARDWALSLAAGVPWRGYGVPEPRNVLWIATEGTHDFDVRWEAQPLWNAAADRLLFLDVPISLLNEADIAWLLSELADQRPGLVVCDVVYGCGMSDDNGTKDVVPVIAAMKKISAAWGAATLAIGHSGHNGARRFRGSSMWNQLAAVEWHAADGMLTCEKSKIADKSKLRWPYKPEYPGLQWQTTGQVLVTAAGRTDLIKNDIAAHPNDSDKARGLRLAQSMGVQPNTARDLIRAVRKGGTL